MKRLETKPPTIPFKMAPLREFTYGTGGELFFKIGTFKVDGTIMPHNAVSLVTGQHYFFPPDCLIKPVKATYYFEV